MVLSFLGGCSATALASLFHAVYTKYHTLSKQALLALHLGLRRSEDAYTLVHKLKRCLHTDCVPAFTTDGLRSYFYAVTAHFGRWFCPPRARTDHWQVDERLLQGQLVKRHERRKLTYTITRMLWGKRQALNDLLENQGFRRLIQTAFAVSSKCLSPSGHR
jgi:hypothetical protein